MTRKIPPGAKIELTIDLNDQTHYCLTCGRIPTSLVWYTDHFPVENEWLKGDVLLLPCGHLANGKNMRVQLFNLGTPTKIKKMEPE